MGLRRWISGLRGREDRDNQSSTGNSAENDSVEDSGNRDPDGEVHNPAHKRELREFVYLDRDSVVSLLASIEGAIKQERTEQIGSQSKERAAGGVNASISGVGAKVEGEQVEMDENSSEVVHNYAVQSLFDQLDQHRRRDEDVGLINSDEEIQMDVSEGIRGEILRVDVELETHYLYRFYKVMMYIQENIPEAIDPEDEDVLELIESMFGAEIPVSGRILDYHIKNGKIHPGDPDTTDGKPIYIVGQLNRSKLWQDIPDALFDQEKYTVFCHIKKTYDEGSWHPLSLAQKIETVSPPLAQVLTQFIERAATLAEDEANEQFDYNSNVEDWKDKLSEFDEQAEVGEIEDNIHQKFISDYISKKGVEKSPPFTQEELVEFYKEYSEHIRDSGVSLSKNKKHEAINNIIFDSNKSIENGESAINIDGLQIESQIVAIYW